MTHPSFRPVSVSIIWKILPFAACLLPKILCAYPPAPGVVVYGTVRAQDGWAINGEQARIVFKSGESVIASSNLHADTIFGLNYRVLLPINLYPQRGAYRAGQIDASLPFTVEVVYGNQIYYPIESSAGLEKPTEAASVLRYDFTLGEDTDGDNIPDDWEYWQLQNGGMQPGSENYNLDQLSRNGDYDADGLTDYEEFLAGTFAYVGTDKLALKIERMDPAGWVEAELLIVQDKAYRFERSTNGFDWEPVDVAIDPHRLDFRGIFRATQTRYLLISIPPDSETRFYRVRVH